MGIIKADNDDVVLDAGAGQGTKFKVDGTEVASVNSTGNLTCTGIDDNATSTAITIDSSENVGIGTTPSTDWRTTFNTTATQVGLTGSLFNLDVSTGDRRCMVSSNAILNASGDFQHILEGQATVYSQQSGTHRWYTAPSASAGSTAAASELMRINSSGQAHIGGTDGGYYATSPTLNVRGGDSTMASAAVEIFTGYATTTKYAMVFCNGNGTIGGIYTNGTSTSYQTSSDYRLKENVVPMTGSIDRLKELKPSRFNFIADADTTVDGFLAHEVSDVVPEAISGEKDAVETRKVLVSEEVLDDDGNITEEAVYETSEQPSYQSIDQSKLVPLLVASLQEAVAKIESLEARVTALEL